MSGPREDAAATRTSQGVYVATEAGSGLQVACDRFRIIPAGGGWSLASEQVPFGHPAPRRRAVLDLEPDWTPRHLVSGGDDGAHLEMDFLAHHVELRTRKDGGWRRLSVPVPRQHALVLLAGCLWAPLVAVRRMAAAGPGPARFRLVPEGSCELRPGPEHVADGRAHSTLVMDLELSGVRDRLHLLLDEAGDVVRFRARNRDLLVVLEPGPC